MSVAPVLAQEIVEGRLGASDWLQAAIIFVVAILIAFGVQRALVHFVERSDSDHSAALLIGRFAGYVIVLIGLVYALATLDVRIGPLLGALGLGGIALAFALQDIVENFIAGILLQVRRPFRRGDQVVTNDFEGIVEDVNLRTVVLRTFDGERVLVPNGQVLKNPIVNHTTHGRRRTTVYVGVAYDTDLDAAQEVLLGAVREVEGVRSAPGPEAYVDEFADSSINFAVRYWHAPEVSALWRVRDRVTRAIKKELDAAGIEIAFPQLTLWTDRTTPMDVRLRSEKGS